MRKKNFSFIIIVLLALVLIALVIWYYDSGIQAGSFHSSKLQNKQV